MPASIKQRSHSEYHAVQDIWGKNGVKDKELTEAQNKERETWLKVEKFKNYLNELKKEDERNNQKEFEG